MIFIDALKTYPSFLTGCIWFLMGLCFGSFANVCIYRIPRKESIILKRSYCPNCGNNIPMYFNIPIIAYLFLKGKCYKCKQKISIRYPIVELSVGLLFLIVFIFFGVSVDCFRISFMFLFLFIISYIDFDRFLIPSTITVTGYFFALLTALITTSQIDIKMSLLGLVISAGFMYVFSDIFFAIFKKEGFGGGDISLLGLIGAFLGWKFAIYSLFTGAFLGVIFSISILLFKKDKKNIDFWRDGVPKWKKIPFGPFISIGTFLVIMIKRII